MLNFLASLGWNDGTEQELFSREELVEKFQLARVQKSGARFDETRLLWMNGQWIRRLELDDLYNRVETGAQGTSFWPAEAADAAEPYKKQVLALAQDRLKTLSDLRGFGYFFAEPAANPALLTENKQLKKLQPSEIDQLIAAAHTKLSAVTVWDAAHIQTALNELLDETGQKPGVLFSLIRVYTTWAPYSPELPATLSLLGRDRSLRRLSPQPQELTVLS
jgi:glutamyl/glutaminyl-tRNA synthetase